MLPRAGTGLSDGPKPPGRTAIGGVAAEDLHRAPGLTRVAAQPTSAEPAAPAAGSSPGMTFAFEDKRWVGGTWDYAQFKGADGETDWDAVIDAEVRRRKLLELAPVGSSNDEKVVFDTSEVPWTAWVKRFHLKEAELLNGRAAMVGYLAAGVVDLLGGGGLVDQQESFLGKLALHAVVFGVLLVRNTKDIGTLNGLADEATFYDGQWQKTWEGVERPEVADD